jgi:hypothetical protein
MYWTLQVTVGRTCGLSIYCFVLYAQKQILSKGIYVRPPLPYILPLFYLEILL